MGTGTINAVADAVDAVAGRLVRAPT